MVFINVWILYAAAWRMNEANYSSRLLDLVYLLIWHPDFSWKLTAEIKCGITSVEFEWNTCYTRLKIKFMYS